MLAAIISFFSGLILTSIVEKERREFEFRLCMIGICGKKDLNGTMGNVRQD